MFFHSCRAHVFTEHLIVSYYTHRPIPVGMVASYSQAVFLQLKFPQIYPLHHSSRPLNFKSH